MGSEMCIRDRCISTDHVSTIEAGGRAILQVDPQGLELLAERAMSDISYYLRTSHLDKVAKIIDDPEASDNDRYVAATMLRNAIESAKGILPMCQDTGTAIVMAKKGERVWTGGGDEAALAEGVLRLTQTGPSSRLFLKESIGDTVTYRVNSDVTHRFFQRQYRRHSPLDLQFDANKKDNSTDNDPGGAPVP